MKSYYSCEPTLNDDQVIDFLKDGYLALKGVVPDEINAKARDFLLKNTSHEPNEILSEDWFIDHVIKNPQATGAVRSLLGMNFGLPPMMSNHRTEYPTEAGGWHRDGNSKFDCELWNLQVFYLPSVCTIDMGPTELVPGSHLLYSANDHLGHIDRIRNTEYMLGNAGSIFITNYAIWHRRSSSQWATTAGVRNLLKYNYHRTVPPNRDWLIEPNFNIGNASFLPAPDQGYFRDRFLAASHIAERFFWLCGKHAQFALKGGQTWPIGTGSRSGERTPYGVPDGI